nr:hypothetical protein CFP56_21920 [Quercus suber]
MRCARVLCCSCTVGADDGGDLRMSERSEQRLKLPGFRRSVSVCLCVVADERGKATGITKSGNSGPNCCYEAIKPVSPQWRRLGPGCDDAFVAHPGPGPCTSTVTSPYNTVPTVSSLLPYVYSPTHVDTLLPPIAPLCLCIRTFLAAGQIQIEFALPRYSGLLGEAAALDSHRHPAFRVPMLSAPRYRGRRVGTWDIASEMSVKVERGKERAPWQQMSFTPSSLALGSAEHDLENKKAGDRPPIPDSLRQQPVRMSDCS